MAVGGEIKSVLTLDSSNFDASLAKLTANLTGLEKNLTGAGKSAVGFEKNVSGLSSDISGAAEQIKALTQTVAGLAGKFASLGNSGFDSVSTGARRAKKDIDGLNSSMDATEHSMAAMTNWIKGYGGSLESLNPLVAKVVKSNQELINSTGAASAATKKAAEASMDAKTAALKVEYEANAATIRSRKQMLVELDAIDRQMTMGKNLAEKDAKKFFGKNQAGGAGFRQEASIFGAQASEAQATAGHIQAVIKELVAANALITESITLNLEESRAKTLSAQSSNRQAQAIAQAAVSMELQESALKGMMGIIGKVIDETHVMTVGTIASGEALLQESMSAIKATGALKAHAAAKAESNLGRNALLSTIEQTRSEFENMGGMRNGIDVLNGEMNNIFAMGKQRKSDQAEVDNMRSQADNARRSAENEHANSISQMWKGMAQLWGASKIEKGFAGSVNQADKMERTTVSMQSLNYSEEHNKAIMDSAKRMSADLGFISTLDAVKSRMSAIASIGHDNAEVIDKTLSTAVKAANNLQYLGMAHGDVQNTIRNLYGVVEMRQQTADPTATNNTFEMMQKIITGTQGKVQTQDMETVLRRVGQGAGQLSDHGMFNLAAIVDQFKVAGGDGGSGGGVSTVGTSIKMMQAYAMGKGKTANAIKEFNDTEILDTGGLDLTKDKAGVLSDAKHAGFKDAALWMNDPVTAIQNIMPKILEWTKKSGNVAKYYQGGDPNDPQNQLNAITKYLNGLGITTNAATAMMTAGDPRSKERIGHQVDTMENSKGIDAVNADQKATYGRLVQEVKVDLENLGVMVGNVLLPTLKSVLVVVGDVLKGFTGFAANNPMTLQLLTMGAAAAGVVLAFKGFAGVFGMAGKMSGALADVWLGLKNTANGSKQTTDALSMLTPAQTAAGRATGEHAIAATKLSVAQKAANLGSAALSGTMAMLGGPIGLIVIALTAAAMAWDYFGNQAEKAAKRAEEAAYRAKAALDGLSTKQDKIANTADQSENKDALEKALHLQSGVTPTKFNGQLIADNNAEVLRLQNEKTALEAVGSAIDLNIERHKKEAEVTAAKLIAQKNARADAGLTMGPKRTLDGEMLDLGKGGKPSVSLGDLSGGKGPRNFEDLFLKSFENISAKADELSLKLRALVTGEGSYDAQGKAAALVHFLAGDYDKSHDPANRKEFLKKGASYNPATEKYTMGGKTVSGADATDMDKKGPDGYSLNDMGSGIGGTLAQADDIKALTFAKERLAATNEGLNDAAARLATDGLMKETAAMRALEREYSREEARNPEAKGKATNNPSAYDASSDYSAIKAKAIANQAKMDIDNFAADTLAKNKSLAAALLTDGAGNFVTANARTLAEQAVVRQQAEDAFQTLLTQTKKNGLDVEAAQRAHAANMALIAKKQAEDMMTPLQKLVGGWTDVRSQIEGSETKWADGFVATLQTALNTGKLTFKSFAASILTDIQGVMLKKAFGDPIKNAVSNIGNYAIDGISSMGAGISKGNNPSAGNATASGFGDFLSKSVTGLKDFWKSITGSTDATVQDTAKMLLGTTAESTKITAESAATSSLTALASAASAASVSMGGSSGLMGMLGGSSGSSGGYDMYSTAGNSDLMSAAALMANGGIVSSAGSLPLNMYSSGGIANSPQLAIFGEGKLNEAYVPLPDGRSIPVTMKSQGQGAGGSNVTISIVVNGGDSTSSAAGGSGKDDWSKVANQVKGIVIQEMANQQRPGGVLYK